MRISRAAADQRAGRAGRERPGLCLRLWSGHDHRGRPERETPEVARIDLAGPALQLLAWGEGDLAAFGWFEPPEPASLARARELLSALGAVDAGGVTPLGRAMAALPLHPRLARLLLAGRAAGATERAALVAALLAERAPFVRSEPGGDGHTDGGAGGRRSSRSDLLDMAEAVEHFARTGRTGPATTTARGRLVPGAARFVLQARDQLVALARRRPAGGLGTAGAAEPRAVASAPLDPEEGLLRAVLAAFPDRLARRREPGSPRALMVGGKGVRLAAESAVREAELFVAVEVDAGRPGWRHRSDRGAGADRLGGRARLAAAGGGRHRRRAGVRRRPRAGGGLPSHPLRGPGPRRAGGAGARR